MLLSQSIWLLRRAQRAANIQNRKKSIRKNINIIKAVPGRKALCYNKKTFSRPEGVNLTFNEWKSSKRSGIVKYPPQNPKFRPQNPNFTLRTRISPSETPNFALRPQISPPETPCISNYRPKHRATRDVIFRLFHFHRIRCLPHNVCMPPPPPTSVCNEIANKRVFSGQVFGL